MEEYKLNSEKFKSVDIVKYEPIKINQDDIKYNLNIETRENMITFTIIDKERFPIINYIRTMNLKEIKELNTTFNVLNSLKDFYDYLKLLSEENKITIKKTNEKLSIILSIEILMKEQSIEIDLFPKEKDINLNNELILEEISDLKQNIKEIESLKKINEDFKNEIKDLKGKNKILEEKIERLENQIEEIINVKKNIINFFLLVLLIIFASFIYIKSFALTEIFYKFFNEGKSVIMKEEEKNFLYSEIERKTNKKIKKIKKLYQATVDGGDIDIFHNKCDDIPNTLVLIKSEGKFRFGGFTPIPWKSTKSYEVKFDSRNETFLFSLDDKQVYHLISTSKTAVWRHYYYGPCFGDYNVVIKGNPIKERGLRTYIKDSSFDFKSNEYPLSEVNDKYYIKASEYEVFQVIFLD